MSSRPTALPVAALLGATMVWGSTFFLIKDLVTHVPTYDFLGVRFLIAGTILVAFRWRNLARCNRLTWQRGVILGVLFGAAQIFQTVGLEHAEASTVSFIVALTVVLTPMIMRLIFGIRLHTRAWAAATLALAGLAILSLNGFSVGLGEALALLSALSYAIHIVFLGQWSRPGNVLDLTAIQLATMAVLFMTAALPGGVVLPSGVSQWSSMIFMAVVAGLLALVVQTWAQAHIPANAAAVIYTAEPVFATFFAVLFGGESLTWRLIVGGSLVMAAMLVNEIGPIRPHPTQGGASETAHEGETARGAEKARIASSNENEGEQVAQPVAVTGSSHA